MITLDEVRVHVWAFEESHLPKMSTAWDALRQLAVEAVNQYARENNITSQQVLELLK